MSRALSSLKPTTGTGTAKPKLKLKLKTKAKQLFTTTTTTTTTTTRIRTPPTTPPHQQSHKPKANHPLLTLLLPRHPKHPKHPSRNHHNTTTKTQSLNTYHPPPSPLTATRIPDTVLYQESALLLATTVLGLLVSIVSVAMARFLPLAVLLLWGAPCWLVLVGGACVVLWCVEQGIEGQDQDQDQDWDWD